MRVAHFVQRYPPALGGSEAYFARLSRYLADRHDQVTVFTTTAVDLEAFWSTRGTTVRPGIQLEDGVEDIAEATGFDVAARDNPFLLTDRHLQVV